jgi:RimJ/RimL family protein N-acetyltransferase
MNWIPHPTVLEGDKVKLVPLDHSHFATLTELAQQKIIWQNISIDFSNPEKYLNHLKGVVLMRANGEQYPFTVIDKTNNKIIGSTRLHNLFPEHKKLEIGWTWYDPAYWGTGYNTECKLLILTFCFEQLKTVRVQLQTSEKNLRSQAAIKKIGAKFEGILRKERIIENGSYRNTVMFSIIDDEWPAAKAELMRLSRNIREVD